MTDVGHMRPYLVRSSCEKLDLNKSIRASGSHDLVLGDNVLGALRRILIKDAHLVQLLVLDEIAGKSCLFSLGDSVHRRKIELIYFP